MPASFATPRRAAALTSEDLPTGPRDARRRRQRLFTGQAALDPCYGLTAWRSAVLGLSWLAVVLLGLTPLLGELYRRPDSAVAPATLAFSFAVSSAALLRHHYNWVGAALHVAGQVMIWLSIFVLTLAALVL